MDFVWNASQAEEVRARSEQALIRQAQELRDAEARFIRRAVELESQANQLAALPTPMRTVTRTVVNANGTTSSRSQRVVDTAALQRRMEQIAELRAQAAEIRRVAGNFAQAAGAIDSGIAASNRLFFDMHTQARQIDQMYSQRIRAAGNDMEAYIRKMEELRDSIGGTFTGVSDGQTQGPMPWSPESGIALTIIAMLKAWLARSTII